MFNWLVVLLSCVVVAAFNLTSLKAQGNADQEYRNIDVPISSSDLQIERTVPDSNELEFIAILNAMRENPTSFLPKIDQYEHYVKSFTKDKKALEKALREIRKRLKSQSPLTPLATSPALQGAADGHVADLGSSGLMSHIGSDDSDPLSRVRRYGSFINLGECITFGYLRADLMVASMLVDEGTPDRGHRESLLKPLYTHVGVGIGPHASLRIAAVVVLGAN